MKRYGCFLLVVVVGFSAAGCMSATGNPNYTASGALAGGATGAIIGSMAENSGAGALIGGAVGAAAGGLIGHGMDQAQEAQLRAQAPQTLQRVEQSQPLTVGDVKALVTAGVSDDLIISQIRNSRTVYHLNSADIIGLKNAGVSDRVIDFMINTPTEISSAAVAGAALAAPVAPMYGPVVVVPPPYYGWGAPWFWVGGRWWWYPGYHRYRPYYYGHGHHR